jgi:hypothetical protein
MQTTPRTSDFPTAVTGFFVGAVLLALVLWFISHETTKRFAGHEGAAPAAEHK